MILGAGFAAFVVAAPVGWFAGPGDPRAVAPTWTGGRGARTCAWLSWALSVLGAALMVLAGASALASPQPVTFSVPGMFGADAVRLDRLSGLFLVITFGVALLALVGTMGRDARRRRPRAGAAAALILLSCAVVLTAGNLFLLYAGWEGIGLSFYLAIGYDRHLPGRPLAAVAAGGFSKVSGAALLLGGLLAAESGGGFTLASFGQAPPGPQRDIAYALLLLAFAIKVGLVPVHLWLPRGYAAAPPVLRAVLAGVAVNVGFYGMWRTLDLLGAPPVWLTCVVLLLAGVTAVLGISHATVHARLSWFVAWSSVENAGVILAGFGVALVGSSVHSVSLLAAGLLAATMQVCAHAVAKTLLFLSTAGVEEGYGTDDLDVLRGVRRRFPVSAAGLLVGALTLAGVPLTAGFASEWLVIEALMQEFRVHLLAFNLTLAVAGALTALTIGTASIAFVRLVALTVFGLPSALPRSGPRNLERSTPYRVAVVVGAAACLALAVVAPLEVRFIAAGLVPLAGRATYGAVDGWVLQPVFSGFSALSPSALWIVLPAFVLTIGIAATLLSRGRLTRVRRVAPWRSGSPGVAGGHGYTSFAFANPLRKVLAAVLLTRNQIRREEAATGGTVGQEERGGRSARLGYTVDVVDIVERYLYLPLVPAGRAVVRTAKRLQSGRLDAYMAYMLVAVVAVLAVVVALPLR